jgi:Domain of unknown function (DUF4349)
MRPLIGLLLIAVLSSLAGCSADKAEYGTNELAFSPAEAEAEAEAAAEAAMAAADAAAATADATSTGGGNAAALRQMGTQHLASEMTSGFLSANDNVRNDRSLTPRVVVAERAMLAYEHHVEIRLDATGIPAKVQALRKDCETSKFGACLVLQVSQSGGRYAQGSITVRAEPKAIDPLIASAGKGGEFGDRRTRAEDLAVAVRDNTLLQERLRKQHVRLLEFQGRSDLKVADVIALSEQLSKVEAELEAAEREGATHKRRVETQLLTLEFSPFAREEQRSEIASALRDSGNVMAASAGGVIRVVSALIPVFLALAIAVWVLRRVWRWVRRRKHVEA